MKFANSRHILKPFEEALLNSNLITKAKGSKVHENLRLGKGNSGYGLYACSHAVHAHGQMASPIAIERGEELLRIPKSVWSRYSAEAADSELEKKSASFHRAVSTLAGRLVPSHPVEAKTLTNVVAMAISLMKSRGEDDAYVNFLRKTSAPHDKSCTPHPLLLDDSIEDGVINRYFGGTKTQRAITLRRKMYTSLSASLFGSDSDMISAEFKWAVSVILSRGLSGSNFPFTMVPVLDFVNHSNRMENALHIFNEPDESFSLIALSPLAWGEEVLISYGRARSTPSFMSIYGFLGDHDSDGPSLQFSNANDTLETLLPMRRVTGRGAPGVFGVDPMQLQKVMMLSRDAEKVLDGLSEEQRSAFTSGSKMGGGGGDVPDLPITGDSLRALHLREILKTVTFRKEDGREATGGKEGREGSGQEYVVLEPGLAALLLDQEEQRRELSRAAAAALGSGSGVSGDDRVDDRVDEKGDTSGDEELLRFVLQSIVGSTPPSIAQLARLPPATQTAFLLYELLNFTLAQQEAELLAAHEVPRSALQWRQASLEVLVAALDARVSALLFHSGASQSKFEAFGFRAAAATDAAPADAALVAIAREFLHHLKHNVVALGPYGSNGSNGSYVTESSINSNSNSTSSSGSSSNSSNSISSGSSSSSSSSERSNSHSSISSSSSSSSSQKETYWRWSGAVVVAKDLEALLKLRNQCSLFRSVLARCAGKEGVGADEGRRE